MNSISMSSDVSGPIFENSLHALRRYIETEGYKGYDPYDTLNSPFPFRSFTGWAAVIATQLQKRNPLNIRPLLGINKEYNPKGMGLMLHAYVKMQELYPEQDFSGQITFLFSWLQKNVSKQFKNPSWGYNFGWAGPGKYLPAYAPTIVATGFIAQGLHAYYLLTKDQVAGDLLCRIAPFITQDIPATFFEEGICFSYSPYMNDCCYNASLLGAETLARIYSLTGEDKLKDLSHSAVNFVVSKQHADGHWKYKLNPETGKERHQVDFHQGYVLDSIQAVMNHTNTHSQKWIEARQKGLQFYKEQQFFSDGRSLWRLPKEYPVEIHNQSQGIITFSRSAMDMSDAKSFAQSIATWTINNMQDKEEGYFYYRKLIMYTNKISFMRWSNAWMLLALSELLTTLKKIKA